MYIDAVVYLRIQNTSLRYYNNIIIILIKILSATTIPTSVRVGVRGPNSVRRSDIMRTYTTECISICIFRIVCYDSDRNTESPATVSIDSADSRRRKKNNTSPRPSPHPAPTTAAYQTPAAVPGPSIPSTRVRVRVLNKHCYRV